MSSDGDAADLMAAFKKGTTQGNTKGTAKDPRQTTPSRRKQPSFSRGQFISDESSAEEDEGVSQLSLPSTRKVVAVRVRPVRNRSEYTYYEPKDTVVHIMREFRRKGEIMYEVKLTSGTTKQVSSQRVPPHPSKS